MIAAERAPGVVESGPAAVLRQRLGLAPGDARLAIHPDDEMLAFLVDLQDGDREQAWCDYLRLGSAIARLMLQVVRWRHGERPVDVLDFASGYGRASRFLLDGVARERLTVADILPGAVAFQQNTLGVRAVLSASQPQDLALDGRFDAILVTSLFTHLPAARFTGFLQALVARLAPGGVLAFSTHDLTLLPPAERPASGFCFRAHSEIAALPTDEYGSTWVDEPFVRRVLAEVAPHLAARRFPAAVCNFQDLWVAVDGDGAALAAMVLRAEPEVHLETASARSGAFALGGWTAGPYCRPVAVEVEVNGALAARLPVHDPRPDVAARHGLADDRCGFGGSAPLPREMPFSSTIALSVVDAAGERWLHWLGRLSAGMRLVREAENRELFGRAVRAEMDAAQAHQRVAELEARVVAMRASRFWRLRDAWFACKRALRLTDEP